MYGNNRWAIRGPRVCSRLDGWPTTRKPLANYELIFHLLVHAALWTATKMMNGDHDARPVAQFVAAKNAKLAEGWIALLECDRSCSSANLTNAAIIDEGHHRWRLLAPILPRAGPLQAGHRDDRKLTKLPATALAISTYEPIQFMRTGSGQRRRAVDCCERSMRHEKFG